MMKKNILLIISLFVFAFQAFAQDTYYLDINVTWDNGGNCYEFCNGILDTPDCPYNSCTLVDEFSSTLIIRDANNNVLGAVNGVFNSFSISYTGVFSVRPKRIEYEIDFCEIVDLDDATTCNSYISSTLILSDTAICYSPSVDNEIFADFYTASEALDIPNVQPEYCNDETIRFTAENDCHNYRYRWLYSTNGTSFSSASTTTFGSGGATRSLNNYVPVGYVGNFIVKAQISFDGGVTYPEETNIINNSIINCSPQIEGEPAIQSATCNYAPLNTGSFTVTFDRPLNDGEQLNNLSLHWAGLDNILDTDDDVSGFDGITGFASYTGTTFTWPNPVPAGTYRFLYQSGGANSAESYEPIIINAPPPIVFTATKNDILCFNDGNGKIIITVDQAGTGNIGTPPYSYSLNGATLVSFTNGNTHTITGLYAGDYSLKVFDDNNCTEQL